MKSRLVHTCFLVDLDGCLVCFYANDFADKLVATNFAQLVHGNTDHVLGDNDRAGHREDCTMLLERGLV